jgi:hypothetical protein
MGKQLVNFITCGCESSAPFLSFTKPGHDIAEILLKVMLNAKIQFKFNAKSTVTRAQVAQ